MWGGLGASGYLNDGISYDASQDTWTLVEPTTFPARAYAATAETSTDGGVTIWGGKGRQRSIERRRELLQW